MSDTDDPPSDEEVIDLCDSDPDSDSGTTQRFHRFLRVMCL